MLFLFNFMVLYHHIQQLPLLLLPNKMNNYTIPMYFHYLFRNVLAMIHVIQFFFLCNAINIPLYVHKNILKLLMLLYLIHYY